MRPCARARPLRLRPGGRGFARPRAVFHRRRAASDSCVREARPRAAVGSGVEGEAVGWPAEASGARGPLMARMVHCIKLQKELEGLDKPPIKGELGQKVFENVS